MSSHKLSVVLQFFGLILAIVAIGWGVFADYSIAFPGPSGEWASLSLLAGYVVNVPVGIISLIIFSTVKRGNSKLRLAGIIASVTVLALPIIGSLIRWLR